MLDTGIQRIIIRVEDPGEDDLDPTLEKKNPDPTVKNTRMRFKPEQVHSSRAIDK